MTTDLNGPVVVGGIAPLRTATTIRRLSITSGTAFTAPLTAGTNSVGSSAANRTRRHSGPRKLRRRRGRCRRLRLGSFRWRQRPYRDISDCALLYFGVALRQPAAQAPCV